MNARPTDDPELAELAELISLLRTVDTDAPAPHLDVEDLLSRARRAERRRRTGWWTAGIGAAAAASVALVVPAIVHFGGPVGVDVPAATTSSATTSSAPVLPFTPPPSAALPGGPAISLQDVYGPDWSDTGTVPGGFGGDLVLVEGSPSAQGLPEGYRAAVRAMTLPLEYSSVGGLCDPMVEKGMTSSGCRDITLADGALVHRVDSDAPNTTLGTWATLRIIYTRADGVVQLVDVVISNVAGTTTAAERSAAQAWLGRWLEPTERAASQVRLLTGPTKS